MRSLFPAVFGNEAVKKSLGDAVCGGKLPHALILEGPAGSGKRTIAASVAAAVLCQNRNKDDVPLPCGVCPACQKIAAGLCPDLTIVAPEEDKTTLSVEKIRAIRTDMVLAANDSDYKIYIVENAESMTAAAQNALLISLEEPPKGVLFFLLTEKAEALLPTVRSRCRLYRTELFEKEELDRYLSGNEKAVRLKNTDKERYEALLLCAGGKIGRALDLLTPSALDAVFRERELVNGVIGALPLRKYSALYGAIAAFPTEKRNEFSSALLCLSDAVRDLILLKRDPDVFLCYYNDRQEALAITEQIGMKRLIAFFDAIAEAIVDLAGNANTTLVFHALADAAKYA